MIQQIVQVSCTLRWPYYTSLEFQTLRNSNKRNAKGLRHSTTKNYFLGRLVPYLERDWLRSLTPAQSKEPRTVW